MRFSVGISACLQSEPAARAARAPQSNMTDSDKTDSDKTESNRRRGMIDIHNRVRLLLTAPRQASNQAAKATVPMHEHSHAVFLPL